MIEFPECQFRHSTEHGHRWRCTCSNLAIPRTFVTPADCQVCPVANGLLNSERAIPPVQASTSSLPGGFVSRWNTKQALSETSATQSNHSQIPTFVASGRNNQRDRQHQSEVISPVSIEVVANWPKHLIYHLYPARGSVWRENINELRMRIALFNGNRIISVAFDGTTESRDVVLAELAELDADVRCVENNRRRGESVSFVPAIQETLTRPGVTFYAHAKGVSHRDSSVVFGIWARRMYSLLDRFGEVSERLARVAFCGLVRATGQPIAEGLHQWHYPGSFYWFRNDVVVQRGLLLIDRHDRFLPEQFPSHIARFTESAALYPEVLHGNPYLAETWQQLGNLSRPLPDPRFGETLSFARSELLDPHATRPPSTSTECLGQPWPQLELTRLSPPRPRSTDTPILNRVNWLRTPTRNLIYHLWPNRTSNNWRWNVEQLKRRLCLFNGVRAIGVATGPDTATLAEVQAEFGEVRIDHWIEVGNERLIGEPGHVLSHSGSARLLGEGLTFQNLLKVLPRGPEQVTFYAHGKGCRYADNGATTTHPCQAFPKDFSQHARRWGEMMYRICLDHWSEVYRALQHQPMAGGFKRYDDFDLPGNWHWHYSGTFFWFRNEDVFAAPQWQHLHPNMYGQVEAWPAGLFKAAEVACLFGDAAGNLYHVDELQKHELALRDWPDDERRIQGVQSDREYYEVESEYRGHKWDDMLGVNRITATLLRDMGCQRVLDVGSGLGGFLLSCQQLGIDATGFDASRFQRDFAVTKGVDPDRYRIARVADYKVEHPVDAIYCCEVFEHCTDAELEPLAKQFAANCRWFYFTSTPNYHDGDDVNGHINVKSREQWISFFSKYGLTFERDDASIVPWGMIYRGKLH